MPEGGSKIQQILYLLIIVGSATLNSTLSTRFKLETNQSASLLRQIGAQDWPVSNCNNQSSSNSEKRGTHLHTICTRAWIPWCGPYESHLRWKPPTWIKNSQDEQKTQRIRPNDAVALNLAQLDAFASHSRFLPHASQISQIYHKYLKMSRSDDLRSGRRNTSLVVPHCISPWAITVALWVIEFLDAKMQRSFV